MKCFLFLFTQQIAACLKFPLSVIADNLNCFQMKFFFLLMLLFSSSGIPAQLTDKQIHLLKDGKAQNDTSFIYGLPFEHGSRYLLVQAYNSKMSHQHELSLDFKMKPGTKVCAAREGVVEAIKEDSDAGGLKEEYLSQGNHIIVRHPDGSVAMYWHLQKEGVIVNAGDSVKKGQPIGLSGNTGYTAFPHLHFEVQDWEGHDMATRFLTKKGVMYLRPGKWYKAVHR
jgi:hypothetical protein